MGSGGSKPKNVTKVETLKSGHVTGSGSVSKTSKNVPEKNKKEDTKSQQITSHQNNNTKVTESAYRNNKSVSKSQSNKKDLGSFESDSDSEAEDINAVLAATKRQVEEQNYLNRSKPQESYPETYAQRLQREQYQQQQQQGLIRQKTIYRNPDEWDIDDNEVDSSFDVSKFKQANVTKPQHQNQLDKDIFSSQPNESYDTGTRQPDQGANMFYTQPQRTRESFPRYDTSEEALLAEIEQEF